LRTIVGVFERTIWWEAPDVVGVLDQTKLPHVAEVVRWRTVAEAADGIATMQVRGAPLIGVAAAHGMALAMLADPTDLTSPTAALAATRPTAVNLAWALRRMSERLETVAVDERADLARELASRMADADAGACRRIGEHGVERLAAVYERTGRPVQVLTHCNAGRLACVEWGTATAPVYVAHERGIPVHVWVSETRPRNQGAALTAWELADAGVPHTLVVDNAAGHLLRSGEVDVVVVGADRIAANGDVANKIGTSLKALAAAEWRVPFVVNAPRSTFDPDCPNGDAVPIEERDPGEVLMFNDGQVAPDGTRARNWGFDITPAHLVVDYVTEDGVVDGRGLASYVREIAT
jgi:methylthioribose-1-phosphate isomerase